MAADVPGGSVASSSLVKVARTVSVPFEASPNGRWVRFEGSGAVVYVVQDAWGSGVSLLVLRQDGGRECRQYLEASKAVGEAVRLISGKGIAIPCQDASRCL